MGMKAVAAVAITVTAIVGTAVYLDHVRTSDPQYKEKVKQRKAAARESKAKALEEAKKIAEEEKNRVVETKNSDPNSKEAVGAYFVAQMQAGQDCLSNGDVEGCATHFANAVSVSDTPIDILVYLKQSIPEELFSLMVKKIDPEVLRDKYFDNFPAPGAGLRVEPTDSRSKQNCVFAVKDYAMGDVVYTESPFLSALETGLSIHEFCAQCATHIHTKVACKNACDTEFYCSEECREAALNSYHAILCSGAKAKDANDPMAKLIAYSKSTGGKEVLMVGKALAQVFNPKPTRDCTADIAHLTFAEPLPSPTAQIKNEFQLLLDVLRTKVEQADQILTLDSYAAMHSKVKRNQIAFTTQPNASGDKKKGQFVKSGNGVYLVGAFMNHSCDPNVKISFVKATNQIQFTARKAITAGDEICFSYNGFSTKTTAQRRADLQKQFDFNCCCAKCEPTHPQPKLSMEELKKKLDKIAEKSAKPAPGASVGAEASCDHDHADGHAHSHGGEEDLE